MKFWFCVLTLFTFLIEAAEAAPRPWGIAVNIKTKECAGYWGGDEFTYYPLPRGWEDYYPETLFLRIKTPYGECCVETGTSYCECCSQLNLTAIDYKTIPYNQNDVYIAGEGPYKCKPASIMSADWGISINEITKECAAWLEYHLIKKGEGRVDLKRAKLEQCLVDRNWVNYKVHEIEDYLITPYGECRYKLKDEKNCCEQLGFKYISDNIGKAIKYSK